MASPLAQWVIGAKRQAMLLRSIGCHNPVLHVGKASYVIGSPLWWPTPRNDNKPAALKGKP